jgi:hypothetical protein
MPEIESEGALLFFTATASWRRLASSPNCDGDRRLMQRAGRLNPIGQCNTLHLDVSFSNLPDKM